MLIVGLILALLGWIFAVKLLWILGLILLVVGAVLMISGSAGHEVGGRRHWW